MKSSGPVAFVVPSTSAPSSTGGVTLKDIMVQLQRINVHLDTFTDELCQVNTRVSRIARCWARFGGFATSRSPSLEASANEDGEDSDDGVNVDAASSFNDDEMTTSQ